CCNSMTPSAPMDVLGRHTFWTNCLRSNCSIMPSRLSITIKSFPQPFIFINGILRFNESPPYLLGFYRCGFHRGHQVNAAPQKHYGQMLWDVLLNFSRFRFFAIHSLPSTTLATSMLATVSPVALTMVAGGSTKAPSIAIMGSASGG